MSRNIYVRHTLEYLSKYLHASLLFLISRTLAGPARPPQAARRLGPARARHAADDLDRDLAAVPAGDRLEGEQLAVVQPGPGLARRVALQLRLSEPLR